MLGRVERTTDFTYGAAPTTFAIGGGNGLRLRFWVEEAEMLIDLVAKVIWHSTVAERVDFTIFVDGADIATGANGLVCKTLDAGDVTLADTMWCARTVRLAQGIHTAELRLKCPVGVPTIAGATIPTELVAMRNSHMATLGHGVDSKALLIQ